MAEIKLTRIKSLYGESKGYLDSIKKGSTSGPYTVPRLIVDKFNSIVDEVSLVSETDYSRSKIPEQELRSIMSFRLVEPLVAAFVTRLELDYGFNQSNNPTPVIAIINDNSNKVTVQTNYSISTLITNQDNEEAKGKLELLKIELEKPDKNWDSIKKILVWVLNFSKELFLEIIPIILQKKL